MPDLTPEQREELRRIRDAISRWDGLGDRGTYKADAEDYGRIDVAILRDVRLLLAALDAREREVAKWRALLEEVMDHGWVEGTPDLVLLERARAALEASEADRG